MRGALSSRIAGALAVAALCALGSSCGAEPASGPNPPAPLPTTDTAVSTAPTSTTTVAPASVEVAPPPAPTKTPTQQPVPPAAKPKPNPAPAPAPVPDPPKSAYYKNCDAARAAGAAPLHRGEPGYRSALDRDNDGIACE